MAILPSQFDKMKYSPDTEHRIVFRNWEQVIILTGFVRVYVDKSFNNFICSITETKVKPMICTMPNSYIRKIVKKEFCNI